MTDEEESNYTPPKVPYASPLNTYGNSIIILTNVNDVLHELELTFRNIKISKEGVTVSLGSALMNDYGISQIIGMLKPIANKNTIMSNIEDREEATGLRDFFAESLALDLMVNKGKYGIVDNTARNRIFTESISLVHLTIKRAYQQGEKKFWKGSQQDINHRISQESTKGSLFPWKKTK